MSDIQQKSTYRRTGGYASPPVPITTLPKVPAGPAPGAHSAPDASTRFAATLRDRRRERGLSQAALATIMRGLGQPWGQSTVAKSEAGTRPVNIAEAVALAAALSTTVGALCGEEPCADPNAHADLIADLVWTRARLARAETDAAAARAAHTAARSAYTAAHIGVQDANRA